MSVLDTNNANLPRRAYRPLKVCISALGYLSVLQGCGSSENKPPPLPSATVGRPIEREVVDLEEYSGRLEAPQFVTITARVGGVIEQAPFDEGSLVQKGDTLFVIDPRPFAADLRSKEADVVSAQSQFAQAEARFNRYQKLQGTRAISAEDYDQVLAAMRSAKAALAIAEAARDVSQLNLEWTKVTAPIAGRVSRKLVTEGNLVTGGTAQATQLTTLVSQDPLHCYITIPERSYLKYRALSEKEKKEGGASGQIIASVRLETESTYKRQGVIDFIDNQVDPSTGTVQVRAVVPNTDGLLTAGLFARMRIPTGLPYKALLIPESVIGTDQNSRFVLVVGQDTTVERRTVKLGTSFGSLRSITEGVTAEDRVVSTGLQQLRPGTKVDVKEVPFPLDALPHWTHSSDKAPEAPLPAVPASNTPIPTQSPATR